MNVVRLTATTVALVGLAAQAQESGGAAERETKQAENAAQALAPTLWTESAAERGSLLPQLNAVLDALRANTTAEPVITVDAAVLAGAPSSSDDNNCNVMPNPGSRIRAERCFVTTAAEQALNKYQFDEELRFARQEADRKRLEEATRALQNEAILRSQRRGP